MITQFNIKTIQDADIQNQKVLVRVDFDVSLGLNHQIADDTRMQQSLPTIKYLLERHNKLILVSKLGRPKERDPKFSLQIVRDKLATYVPDYNIMLVNDFLTDTDVFAKQTEKDILLLENIRFYPEEKKNDPEFAKKLASLAQVYVLDAFAMAHRSESSVVGIEKYLPSYAGLLLEKEINAISQAMNNPKKPVIAIIGGAKISTKLPLLFKLTEMADYLLLGGGIANTFLAAQGIQIGKSLVEPGQEDAVKQIMQHAISKQTTILLPQDVICATDNTATSGTELGIKNIPADKAVFDIGPETQAIFGKVINQANTIIWNGPVGYTENPAFTRGTDFLYYAIAENDHAYSLVGGGDTLASISKKEYLDKISHISTGGGAMLEFIEKGTLPGIEALKETMNLNV